MPLQAVQQHGRRERGHGPAAARPHAASDAKAARAPQARPSVSGRSTPPLASTGRRRRADAVLPRASRRTEPGTGHPAACVCTTGATAAARAVMLPL